MGRAVQDGALQTSLQDVCDVRFMAWIVLVDCRACGHVEEQTIEREYAAGFERTVLVSKSSTT